MIENFELAFSRLLKHEGGFVNHPSDPGGATNLGISLRFLRQVGVDLNGDNRVDKSDIHGLKEKDARWLYRKFFWNVISGDDLPPGLDFALFDYAVNSGTFRAVMTLQDILNQDGASLAVDGVLGQLTLSAINGASLRTVTNLIAELCDERLRFMRSLSIFSTFGKGWTRRVDETEASALELAIKTVPVMQKPIAVSDPPIWRVIWNAIKNWFTRKRGRHE